MSAPSAEVRAPLVPLERAFYDRATTDVARDLLGLWVVRSTPDGLSGGPIVETEAYGGPEDLASHARAGLTRRTTPMFGEVGHAYVYLVYGMHECLNVVAYNGASAGAVLIRAIAPGLGIDEIRRRRGRPTDPTTRLCSGPAMVCQGLAVDRSFDGHDLTLGEGLWLGRPPDGVQADIASGSRVGVDYAGGWAAKPWRFWMSGHPSVSRGTRGR
ncbi:MAG: DNA-3-methyladenine glycosylase [Chloroflexota bacterium]|jgi:DNA-3-methyladenine glycosylase|nr:DNA-3-methyladenine glycosylase [Chloroflexota bacterium]